jgi:hypothetical protein
MHLYVERQLRHMTLDQSNSMKGYPAAGSKQRSFGVVMLSDVGAPESLN